MATFCWGSTIHGELGLGGVEDEQILLPREMNWSESPDLCQAACGTTHTLLLTNKGKLFSCGNNDYGQLGQDLSRKRPQLILSLENYVITQITCGAAHSLAITDWGNLYSWGSDTYGQLGNTDLNSAVEVQPIPKLVKTLATKHIVQITSGHFHSLALTNNGEIYSWGKNSYGQLGLGFCNENVRRPKIIKSLAGIPIAFIACGGNHSFAVSKSGAVFGWGKNSFGQLGLNDEESRCFPTQLKTLRNQGVRFVSCGDDFSVFLTYDGGVLTCGAGNFGQLGHGGLANEILPRMVMELMGSTTTQISCGRRHTLALVPSRGRVYGFGLGGSGQLGARTTTNSSVPQVVIGPWVSPSGVALLGDDITSEKRNLIIKQIFSGGDHCFVSVVEQSSQKELIDLREYSERTQILSLNESLATTCSLIPLAEAVDLELIKTIETIFKSQACVNGSFLSKNDTHFCCSSKNPGVCLMDATNTFTIIRRTENIWDTIITDLMTSLVPSPPDVETLRIYLTLPLYHEFANSKNYLKLHSPFSGALLRLTHNPLKVLSSWWANTSRDYFESLIEIFKGVVSYLLNFYFKRTSEEKQLISYEPNLVLALDSLLLLFNLNKQHRSNKVPYDVFYIPELTDDVDIQRDYYCWLMEPNHTFSLCSYAFIFDAKAKSILLQTDQAIQMRNAMQTAFTRGLIMMASGVSGNVSQFIVLNVTRENLVADTLRELSQYNEGDLKKPLKVKFHGEEAEDAGGVRKEFFMLLLKDILDPKYGMFREFKDSRAIWFYEDSFEGQDMYFLIGIICGLVIYNFTIIDLPFTLALYKKLLNEPTTLSDLKELNVTLANSLQSILDYAEPDFDSVFNLTFEISSEVFGEAKTFPLKPNGENIIVSLENKLEFVDLYIDFIFNKSVEKQFKGFHEGFMKVCGGRLLKLFQPHELMAVIVGNEDYDWHSLEADTEYKNGYTSGDQTIRWFWEVFHELSLVDKKKFLLYLTGSDRIPIQGMKAIKMYIQPTENLNFLPVAHTCFNLLDLPRYKTKEKLKYKLLQAIQQTLGFSLV